MHEKGSELNGNLAKIRISSFSIVPSASRSGSLKLSGNESGVTLHFAIASLNRERQVGVARLDLLPLQDNQFLSYTVTTINTIFNQTQNS